MASTLFTSGKLSVVEVDVLESSSVEKMEVTGGGGGVFQVGDRVYGMPVRIETHHTRSTEVWVRFASGGEGRWVFPADIPVRTGQRLAAIFYDKEIWAFRNVHTGSVRMYTEFPQVAFPGKPPQESRPGNLVLLYFLCPILWVGGVLGTFYISDKLGIHDLSTFTFVIVPGVFSAVVGIWLSHLIFPGKKASEAEKLRYEKECEQVTRANAEVRQDFEKAKAIMNSTHP